MTEKRAIHIARHRVVAEARGHYYNPTLPTKYLDFWRMVLAALIKAKAERPVDKSDDFGDTVTSCPGCGKPVINYYNPSVKPCYCMLCGQKLDWQAEKESDKPYFELGEVCVDGKTRKYKPGVYAKKINIITEEADHEQE